MEIDYLLYASSLSSAQNTGENAPPNAKLEGIFSMDEFLSDFGAEHAAAKAAKSATAAMKLPAGLTAVGARSSKNTIAIHAKYQALGIQQPQFTFGGGANDEGWTAQVSFTGLEDVDELQCIKDDRRFPSKQEAKEALSERALALLEKAEKEGKVKKVEAGGAKKVSKYTVALHDKYQKLRIPQPHFTYDGSTELGWTAEVSFPSLGFKELDGIKDEKRHQNKKEAKEATSKIALEAVEAAEKAGQFAAWEKGKEPAMLPPKPNESPGPNYPGQLLEFQCATGAPQPTYHHYTSNCTPMRFACLVEIDGHPSPFGSLESLHSSKKAARQEAARYTVESFKSQGLWPDDFSSVGGIKKKPNLQPSPLTELTARKPSTASAQSASESFAQQVARLAIMLSLGTPEWRYTPSTMDKDFHTVQCFFNGGGMHKGPIGEVRNVLGKKKAKEECARLTLEYLGQVREHRVAYGQRMMEGISGGEGLIDAAAAKPREGEEEAMAAMRRVVKDMGGDSDEEMEFEDAVEVRV